MPHSREELRLVLGFYWTPKSGSHETQVLRKLDFIRSSVPRCYTDMVGGFMSKETYFSSGWAISFHSLLPPLLWWEPRRELADISTTLQFHSLSFLPWEICGLNFHHSEPRVIYIFAVSVWEQHKPILSTFPANEETKRSQGNRKWIPGAFS